MPFYNDFSKEINWQYFFATFCTVVRLLYMYGSLLRFILCCNLAAK